MREKLVLVEFLSLVPYCAILSLYCAILPLYCAILSLYCAILSLYCAILPLYCAILLLYCAILPLYCAILSLPSWLSLWSALKKKTNSDHLKCLLLPSFPRPPATVWTWRNRHWMTTSGRRERPGRNSSLKEPTLWIRLLPLHHTHARMLAHPHPQHTTWHHTHTYAIHNAHTHAIKTQYTHTHTQYTTQHNTHTQYTTEQNTHTYTQKHMYKWRVWT